MILSVKSRLLKSGLDPGMRCHGRVTRIELKAFKNIGKRVQDLLSRKTHFFIGISVVAVIGQSFHPRRGQ